MAQTFFFLKAEDVSDGFGISLSLSLQFLSSSEFSEIGKSEFFPRDFNRERARPDHTAKNQFFGSFSSVIIAAPIIGDIFWLTTTSRKRGTFNDD